MGTARVGISAIKGRNDLTDLPAHLDEIQAFGVDTVELPMYDMDLVVGAKPLRPHIRIVKSATADRKLGFTVHGPLATNFFDPSHVCERHLEVLRVCLEVAAEIGAVHYVMHTGFLRRGAETALEDAFARQRDYLARAGEIARVHGITVCVENLFDWEWGRLTTATASRLAAEIEAVGHPNIRATIDFGHCQLETGLRGGDTLAELKPLAPHARHLHVHDGFGRPDDIYMYTEGERLAYGHGDLHMPVGWGSTPWEAILTECTFPAGVVFNVELNGRYWHFARECVERTREMAARARTGNA